MKELRDTVAGMLSMDYKQRLLAEHAQLTIRLEKLLVMLQKYRNNELTFTPSCSYDLLHKQAIFMEAYLAVLNQRIGIEIKPDQIKHENTKPYSYIQHL